MVERVLLCVYECGVRKSGGGNQKKLEHQKHSGRSQIHKGEHQQQPTWQCYSMIWPNYSTNPGEVHPCRIGAQVSQPRHRCRLAMNHQYHDATATAAGDKHILVKTIRLARSRAPRSLGQTLVSHTLEYNQSGSVISVWCETHIQNQASILKPTRYYSSEPSAALTFFLGPFRQRWSPACHTREHR